VSNHTPLLRPKDAADLLAISPRKLWSITRAGEVPHIRIGRNVRYCPTDLATWIEDRKQGGQAHA
jgi:excisionase family DNA binding protein